jgi:DNA primase large subunit
MAVEDLRQSTMMNHLLSALERGEDIGHYGRLVFAMVARHFLDDDQLVEYLTKNPDFPIEKARALVEQVRTRDYSPPRRERIREWQKLQDFPICPDLDDPDQGNLYRELRFPEHVYEHISEYHEEKAQHEARQHEA